MGLLTTNNRVRSTLERRVAANDTGTNSGTINAGDLLYDTGSGVASLKGAATLTAAIVAEIGKFKGVSLDTYPIPYSDSLTETVSDPDVAFYVEGDFRLHSTASDSLAPGTAVRPGAADAQTVKVAEVGPDCSPSGLFTAGTVTGGTLLAATYTVTATYITAIGETMPGTASAGITATAGQGIIYDYDNAGAFTIPAWALGVAIYIDGVFAASIMSGSTALGADLDITGISLTNPRPVPTKNALAIGTVAEDQTAVGSSVGGTVTGASGQDVVIKITPRA
jgi:hypothetical protein